MKNFSIVSIAVLSLFSGQAFAQSSNTHESVVSSQIRSAEAAYLSLGFRRVTSTGSQSLNDDASTRYNLPVVQGQRYAVLGACDSDCSDLDIKVTDTSGNVVVQDAATDDLPTGYFEAAQTGNYSLEVKMYQCTTNPCYYQAVVVTNAQAAAAAASTSGGSQYDQQVNSQLDSFERLAEGQNYRRLFRSPMLHLNDDATESYTVSLLQGVNYRIGGVCDNDCPDLDIKLIDPSGREVAADVLTDSVPIVDYRAAQGGAYTVRVVMYNCTSNPCSAALTVMAQR